MTRDDDCVTSPTGAGPNQTAAEHWLRVARADHRICHELAQRGARLDRSLRAQRVAWRAYGHVHAALLLPDPAGQDRPDADEWYLYYVAGESLFRRNRSQRAQVEMLVLPDSAEDWAELLRQALKGRVFDVRHEVVPDYINASGETELSASGFVFTLEAYAPGAVGTAPLRVAGAGATPEQAARAACRQWLADQQDRGDDAPDA